MKTKPDEIPLDVRKKLMAIREALLDNDMNDAWHHLYSIADPDFSSLTPWDEIAKDTEFKT